MYGDGDIDAPAPLDPEEAPPPFGALPPGPPTHVAEVATWCALGLVVAGLFGLTFVSQVPEDFEKASTRLELRFQSRYAVGVHALFGKLGESFVESVRPGLVEQLESAATTPAERLSLVPVVAELAGREKALEKISRLRQEPDLPEDVRADLDLLDNIYGGGEITDEERAGFVERREWFARLALSQMPGHTEAERDAVLADSIPVAVWMIALVMAVVAAGIAGLGLLAAGFVQHQRGKLRTRYDPGAGLDAAGRLPFLETVVVFLVATVGASLAAGLVFAATENQSLTLFATVLAVPAVLWPYLRGAGSAEVRHAYGWHRGTGFWREVGCGLVGYVAGAPLLILGLLLSVLLSTLMDETPYHPLMEGVTEAGPAGILMIYLVACVTAPLAEETVFRGGFYHYLRGRLGILGSALVVSVIFAGIHPQGILGVPPLVALALILALIREWRGSLVASVAVHALHNALATTVLFVMLS